MSNQEPMVAIGTKLAAGNVVAIKSTHVVLETPEGQKPFTFKQIEEMVIQAIATS